MERAVDTATGGFEVICKSEDCINHEGGGCKLLSPKTPIILVAGACCNYKSKED